MILSWVSNNVNVSDLWPTFTIEILVCATTVTLCLERGEALNAAFGKYLQRAAICGSSDSFIVHYCSVLTTHRWWYGACLQVNLMFIIETRYFYLAYFMKRSVRSICALMLSFLLFSTLLTSCLFSLKFFLELFNLVLLF